MTPAHALQLIDLRDPSLAELGRHRKNISSSSPAHYPCTRRVARAVHAIEAEPQGVIRHSPQAGLTSKGARDAAVISADRIDIARGSWALHSERTAAGSLLEGAGLLLFDDLADALVVMIEVKHDLDE